MSRRAKKDLYHAKLCKFLEDFEKAFIVHADNVGSKQFMDVRRGLYPDSVILMGKNTMMKRSIRLYCEQSGNEYWATVIPELVGNVGIVFTRKELNDLKDEIAKYKVGAPARVGAIAPKDVVVPAGSTGMDPSQTSFFQALGIATKINRGSIEIVTDVHLIEEGKKVGGSEATLLAKLGIKPFEYGLKVMKVYNQGALYDPKVLDIKDEDILTSVNAGIANVAAVALQTGLPTTASTPHVVINAFKNILSIALSTEFSFPLGDKMKEILENPEAFAVAVAAPAATTGDSAPAMEEKKVEEEEEESEDDDMGFSLFD